MKIHAVKFLFSCWIPAANILMTFLKKIEFFFSKSEKVLCALKHPWQTCGLSSEGKISLGDNHQVSIILKHCTMVPLP